MSQKLALSLSWLPQLNTPFSAFVFPSSSAAQVMMGSRQRVEEGRWRSETLLVLVDWHQNHRHLEAIYEDGESSRQPLSVLPRLPRTIGAGRCSKVWWDPSLQRQPLPLLHLWHLERQEAGRQCRRHPRLRTDRMDCELPGVGCMQCTEVRRSERLVYAIDSQRCRL